MPEEMCNLAFQKPWEKIPLPLNLCVNPGGSYRYWINSSDKYVLYESAKPVFLNSQFCEADEILYSKWCN